MVTLYKLTDRDGYTRRGMTGETLWKVGELHTAPGNGRMCSSAYIHAYTNLNLAAFMNPAHAGIEDPLAWEAEGVVGRSNGVKVGCTSLKITKRIKLPTPSNEQRIAFGILAALCVSKNDKFDAWASNWLCGHDRSERSCICIAYDGAMHDSASYSSSAAAYSIYSACAASSAADEAHVMNIQVDFAAIADYVMSRDAVWDSDVSRFINRV